MWGDEAFDDYTPARVEDSLTGCCLFMVLAPLALLSCLFIALLLVGWRP